MHSLQLFKRRNLGRLVEKGTLKEADAKAAEQRLTTSSDLDVSISFMYACTCLLFSSQLLCSPLLRL